MYLSNIAGRFPHNAKKKFIKLWIQCKKIPPICWENDGKRTIALPFILTVFRAYFLPTAVISAIKEETVTLLKSKNTKKLVKILCVELMIHNI